MSKKPLFLLLLATMLVGCSNNPSSSADPSISDNPTSEVTPSTSENVTTSEDKSTSESSEVPPSSEESSEESSESSSEEVIPETKVVTIKEAKELAKPLFGKENEVGVYESDIRVSLKKVQLVDVLDAITTKQGYGSRYKLLVADNTGYMYIKVPQTIYENMKKYRNDKSSYDINGTLGLYNDEVEVICNEKPTWLKDENNYVIDYDKLSTSMTLSQIYEATSKLKMNGKGIAFSYLVNLDVQCLGKDFENSNVYFGSGDYIINVHGSDKLYNKFTKGTSYHLVGALQMFNYRPGLIYVDHKVIQDEVAIDYANLETKTCEQLYNYKYETDKQESYPEYSKYFEKPFKLVGYFNAIDDGLNVSLTFGDKFFEGDFANEAQASAKNQVFFKNKNMIKFTVEEFDNSINTNPMVNCYYNGFKVEMVVFPYLWNTHKFPQVYCYSFTQLETIE